MSELFILFRDLYAASAGVVPGPAWTATFASILWVMTYHDIHRVGRRYDRDVEESEDDFRNALAGQLGWTRAELEEFWNNPRYDFGPDDARRFDETRDAWDRMIRMRRER